MSKSSRRVPTLEELTTEQKIGQLFCFGWDAAPDGPATGLNSHLRELLSEMHVGGIVVMARNYASPAQCAEITRQIQELSTTPAWIAIDQEGGRVNRIPEPLHQFAGNMALGATGEEGPALARRQAEVQSRELLSLGVNWTFAPCVDVNNNSANPVIGLRSFGEWPERVAAYGIQMIRGYQETGLLACAKHFPGHGDTDVDSHLTMPVVPHSLDRMNAVELVPFRAAISAGVGAIMTTHILFPALDDAMPSTLSRSILTGLLRETLGYDGLIVTDCLEMDAIANGVGTPQGALQAIMAGADMALACHTLSVQRETYNLFIRAVETGQLTKERLNESVSRVLAAKSCYLSAEVPVMGDVWNDPVSDALEAEIAARSITVVRNDGSIPIRCGSEEPIGVLSAHAVSLELAETLRAFHPCVSAIDLHELHFIRSDDEAVEYLLEEFGVLVVLTTAREALVSSDSDVRRQFDLVRNLDRAATRRNVRLILIAIHDPYDLAHFDDAPNYICTYGHSPAVIRALADLLMGQREPSGELPVTL